MMLPPIPTAHTSLLLVPQTLSSWAQLVGVTHPAPAGVGTCDHAAPSQCQIPPSDSQRKGPPLVTAQTSFAALPQTALKRCVERTGSDHALPSQCMMPSSPTAHASVGLAAQTPLM